MYIVYKFYNRCNQSSNIKALQRHYLSLYSLYTTGQTGSPSRSDRSPVTCPTLPVRPVHKPVRPVSSKTNRRLHTLPTSVQSSNFLVQEFGPITSHLSASRRTNLTQQVQKSISVGSEMIVITNPEQLTLSKTYPTMGIHSSLSKHAMLLASSLFC